MWRMMLVVMVSMTSFGLRYIANGSSNRFVKTTQNISGPARLSSGWVDRSRSSCAVNCQTRFSAKCRSFMYSSVTKLCTPASDLFSYCPPPTVSEGDLFSCVSCPSYPKFSDYVNGSTRVSYMYNTNFLTYADATTACNSVNSQLFVPDTMEKFRLFSAIIDPSYYTWVGLDDRDVEGKFVWANTGLEIDPDFKTSVFTAYQSYGRNDDEDCMHYVPGVYGLHDGACALTMRYVCEKSGCYFSSWDLI